MGDMLVGTILGLSLQTVAVHYILNYMLTIEDSAGVGVAGGLTSCPSNSNPGSPGGRVDVGVSPGACASSGLINNKLVARSVGIIQCLSLRIFFVF